jgi:hypothetical protein
MLFIERARYIHVISVNSYSISSSLTILFKVGVKKKHTHTRAIEVNYIAGVKEMEQQGKDTYLQSRHKTEKTLKNETHFLR